MVFREVKTVQLSLAVSGREDEAWADAHRMADIFSSKGYEVLNPFDLCQRVGSLVNHKEQENSANEYWWLCMDVCCRRIVKGVDVLLIIGPKKFSYGVDIETQTAIKTGAKIIDMRELYGQEIELDTFWALWDEIKRGDLQISIVGGKYGIWLQ